MAEDFFDPILVQKLIKAAKDTPVNFAFVQASSPDKSLLGVDKHKQGEQIFAVLKKEAGSTKGCSGTVICDGGTAQFSCDKPISGFEKQLTDWFRRNKISLKASLAGTEEVKDAPSTAEPPPKAEQSRQAEAKADAEEAEEEEEDLADEPDKIFTEPYLRAMLKRSKNAPVNFAFGFGDKPDNDRMTMHPRKAALALSLQVKRENAATRMSFGTAVWEGQEVIFTCEKKPVSGLKKRIRRMFKEWKLPLKPVIFGPEGRFDEEGDEIDEEESATATPGAADGALAALAAELKAMLPHLQELVRANPALVDGMRTGYQECDRAIKAADAAAAAEALAKLRQLGDAAEQSGPDANAGQLATLAAELKALLPHLQELVRANPALVDGMRAGYQDCDKAIKAGDADAAAQALAKLRKLGDAAGNGPDMTQMLAALAAELKELLPHLQDLGRANPAMVDGMRASYQDCDKAIKAGDAATARRLLDDLKALGGSAAPAEDPEIARLRAGLERRMGEVRAAIALIKDAAKAKDRDDLAKSFYQACVQALNGGNVAAAKEALVQLAPLAKPPIDARAEVRAAKGPLTFDFSKAQLEWAQARTQTVKAIQSLQQELRDILKDEEDFPELDREIARLDSVIINFDESLDQTFVNAINATDQEKKLEFKTKAHEQVKNYITFAQSNPYLSKMDSIPDRPMTVFADLMAHLKALDRTLA